MSKTFNKIKTSYPNGFIPTTINTDGFRVEINPNDDVRALEITVFILTKKPASINQLSPLVVVANTPPHWNSLQQATLSSAAGATVIPSAPPLKNTTNLIFTIVIPFDQLGAGNNAISLSLSYNTLPQTSTPTVISPFFTITGVLEDDEVQLVKLERAAFEDTKDQAFWTNILDPRHSLNFKNYQNFIDMVLSKPEAIYPNTMRAYDKRRGPFIASDEYNVIKFATEAYMLKTVKLNTDSIRSYLGTSRHLPYFDFVMEKLMNVKAEDKDDAIYDTELKTIDETDWDTELFSKSAKNPNPVNDIDVNRVQRLDHPFMIELIWSYWMEQGMLVQTMSMVNLRFQNIKVHRGLDPLMRFDHGPLRPMSHILWGYIQDEQHRLSLTRRVYEYDHEYGLTLTGRAVGRVNGLDTRVKFLEAFHNLLNSCILFYREYDNTTVVADGFPTLNNLREVHLLLAEGNHNAYGDLTWTARHEMLVQQYILARPEMREFLGGRIMVPYPEKWMDRVDMMRNLQGWGGNDILSYYELAVHGEKILLSIRYGNWSDVTLTQDDASNWAVAFRNNVQRYVHAYRVVTGVDLSATRLQEVRDYATQPAFLIQQRFGRKDLPVVRPKSFVRTRNY